MIAYLMQSSLTLFILYGFYWVGLKQTTFFAINRWILLCILVLSMIAPLMQFYNLSGLLKVKTDDVSMIATKFEQIEEFGVSTNTGTNSEATLEGLVAEDGILEGTNLWVMIYIIGILIFSLKFLGGLIRLIQINNNAHLINQSGRIKIKSTGQSKSSFNFLNIIFVNDSRTADEIIIAHEMVHAEEGHSIDLILAELFKILFWFHPFSWMLKSSIQKNLEHVVDSKMCQQFTKNQYVESLVKYTIEEQPLILTNTLKSFLKNRIAMINRTNSPRWHTSMYVLFIGVSLICLGFQKTDDTYKVTVKSPSKFILKKDSIDYNRFDSALIFGEEFTDDGLERMRHSIESRSNYEMFVHHITRDPKSQLLKGMKIELKSASLETVILDMPYSEELGTIIPGILFFNKINYSHGAGNFNLSTYKEMKAGMKTGVMRIGYAGISDKQCLEIGNEMELMGRSKPQLKTGPFDKYDRAIIIGDALTNNELFDLKKELMANHGVSLRAHQIKRNRNNEITLLALEMRTTTARVVLDLTFNDEVKTLNPGVFYLSNTGGVIGAGTIGLTKYQEIQSHSQRNKSFKTNLIGISSNRLAQVGKEIDLISSRKNDFLIVLNDEILEDRDLLPLDPNRIQSIKLLKPFMVPTNTVYEKFGNSVTNLVSIKLFDDEQTGNLSFYDNIDPTFKSRGTRSYSNLDKRQWERVNEKISELIPENLLLFFLDGIMVDQNTFDEFKPSVIKIEFQEHKVKYEHVIFATFYEVRGLSY